MKIQHIAVRLPNWLGDAVMATPTLAHLRKMLPQARITAVGQPNVLELLEGLPFFDDTIPVVNKKIIGTVEAECGLLLTGSFSSAWHFFRMKIPIRIGFSCHFRRLLLTHPISLPHDERLHDVLRYQQLLSPLMLAQRKPEETKLHLHVSDEEKKQMQERLKSSGIHPWHTLLVINPGAAYGEAKCWPKEYFKEVVNHLKTRPDLYSIVIGSTQSIPLAEELQALMPEKILSLAGKTSLRELLALLSLADCVLTNDSGPMHMAAALHTPLVALFGSTNPLRTGPWQCGTVLYEKVDCSPCYLRKCPIDFRCMKRITPQKVIDALELETKNKNENR